MENYNNCAYKAYIHNLMMNSSKIFGRGNWPEIRRVVIKQYYEVYQL